MLVLIPRKRLGVGLRGVEGALETECHAVSAGRTSVNHTARKDTRKVTSREQRQRNVRLVDSGGDLWEGPL